MAFTYENTPNLSKVKIGDAVYYLKDSDLRSIVDGFGTIVHSDKTSTITSEEAGIPDAKTIYAFVINQIASVGKAVNLRAETDHTEVEEPSLGDLVIEADGSEWLFDGTDWREVGSEGSYVPKTRKVAGLSLKNDIDKKSLSDALQLKGFAWAEEISIPLNNYSIKNNPISTVAPGEYELTGTPVNVPATFNSIDYTPQGQILIMQTKAPTYKYQLPKNYIANFNTPTDAQVANYTPKGTVTVDNISIIPEKVNVATVTDLGSAYSLTDGGAIKGIDTKSSFATEGLIASVDTTDTEMLVLTAAQTSQAVTESGNITYTPQQLSGSLPTFGQAQVVTGIESATADAVFEGDGTYVTVTTVGELEKTVITSNQAQYTGVFTGVPVSLTPTVATTASVISADAKVELPETPVNVELMQLLGEYQISAPIRHWPAT